ncbi:hypothetical protein C2845_PM03G19730 [Panicum miliaceum]|uniref:Uncharacterized protein n=1 Tax=Panicum miliaceum TaxID=4540 RepID=A0A3L6TDR5_PANMI|nr:hypothetical protein C2845_PM03G19730 [Panicum miliaceum]
MSAREGAHNALVIHEASTSCASWMDGRCALLLPRLVFVTRSAVRSTALKIKMAAQRDVAHPMAGSNAAENHMQTSAQKPDKAQSEASGGEKKGARTDRNSARPTEKGRQNERTGGKELIAGGEDSILQVLVCISPGVFRMNGLVQLIDLPIVGLLQT